MKITPDILKKYHAGECTPAENDAVEQWLAGGVDPVPDYITRQSEFDLKRRMWNEVQKETNFKRIPNRGLYYWIAAAAACIVLVFGLLTKLPSTDSSLQTHITYQTIKTRNGQKMKIYLPDSTLVVLNAGSELRFPSQFEDSARKVTLIGEAYFKVTKDATRPFTIESQHTKVRVLGTAFTLRSYTNENTRLVVEEGKVRFSEKNGNEALILTAEQKGEYSSDEKSLTSENVYSSRYLSWKENKLEFSNESLAEIAPVLERWYGIKVQIKSKKTATIRFSGSYENPPLSILMEEMALLMKFNYKISDNRLVIE